MAGGPMDWWYWFGMWIAGASSVILVFWLSLDASRRRGSLSRFSWPLIASTGFVIELPAFAITGSAQASVTGTAAAAAGLAGLTLVSISTIAYFSKSSGNGSTWFTRTRDNDSFISGARERRPGASARASVPVGGRAQGARTPRTPTPVDFSEDRVAQAHTTPDYNPHISGAPASPGTSFGLNGEPSHDADATIVVSDDVRTVMDERPSGLDAAANKTVTTEDASVDSRTVVADDHESVSSAPSHELTVADDTTPPATSDDSTIIGDVETDETISDEPDFATVLDEPEGRGGRLVITDGRSSRIVITERSGPFVVGRDPARSNLAVDDRKVSRAHLAISRIDDEYVISDLDSSNGTFVNGEMLREARVLADGDTVEFGRSIAKFVIDDEPANE